MAARAEPHDQHPHRREAEGDRDVVADGRLLRRRHAVGARGAAARVVDVVAVVRVGPRAVTGGRPERRRRVVAPVVAPVAAGGPLLPFPLLRAPRRLRLGHLFKQVQDG